MKKLFIALLPLVATFAFAENSSVQVVSKIDHLFIPHGFDDNDVVEVVLYGHFPSSCYQLGETLVQVDDETKTVTITPTSYRNDTTLCIEMLSHYTQVVKVGHMKQGDYSFKITANPDVEASLNVSAAEISERDDYLYPPVDYANVIKGQDGSETLIVSGRYPLLKRGCMKTDAATVDFQEGEMLVVQPKATIDLSQSPDGSGCTQKYEKKFRLPYSVGGRVLLHVRAINGQSYNRVLDVDAKVGLASGSRT